MTSPIFPLLITNDFTLKELINMMETVTLRQSVVFGALNQVINVGSVLITISALDVKMKHAKSKVLQKLQNRKVNEEN